MASDNRPDATEFTPTTEEVRGWYDAGREQNNWEDVIDPGAEFDRWFAAHDAEVKADAWDEGMNASVTAIADELDRARYIDWITFSVGTNPYRKGE